MKRRTFYRPFRTIAQLLAEPVPPPGGKSGRRRSLLPLLEILEGEGGRCLMRRAARYAASKGCAVDDLAWNAAWEAGLVRFPLDGVAELTERGREAARGGL